MFASLKSLKRRVVEKGAQLAGASVAVVDEDFDRLENQYKQVKVGLKDIQQQFYQFSPAMNAMTSALEASANKANLFFDAKQEWNEPSCPYAGPALRVLTAHEQMHTTTRNHIAYVFTDRCINPLNSLVQETCPYIDRLIRDRGAAKTDVESYTRRLRVSEGKLEKLNQTAAVAEKVEKQMEEVNKLRGKLQRSRDAYEKYNEEAKINMKKIVHERFDHVHREFGALVACQVAFFNHYSKSLESAVNALGKPYSDALATIETQIKSGTLPETEEEICPPLQSKFWNRTPRISFSDATPPYRRSASIAKSESSLSRSSSTVRGSSQQVKHNTSSSMPAVSTMSIAASSSSVPANNMQQQQQQQQSLGNSSVPRDGTHCQATFSFHPQEENELEFKKGDIIRITAQDDPGWWQGVNTTSKKQGIFPSNYVKVLQ